MKFVLDIHRQIDVEEFIGIIVKYQRIDYEEISETSPEKTVISSKTRKNSKLWSNSSRGMSSENFKQ